MKMNKSVIIDGTISGTINEDTVDFRLEDFIGEKVNYHYHDENECEAIGVLTEILD
jgi:hypothetical protein